jgi:hypothetical protein
MVERHPFIHAGLNELWGTRGPEFESRRPDSTKVLQKPGLSLRVRRDWGLPRLHRGAGGSPRTRRMRLAKKGETPPQLHSATRRERLGRPGVLGESGVSARTTRSASKARRPPTEADQPGPCGITRAGRGVRPPRMHADGAGALVAGPGEVAALRGRSLPARTILLLGGERAQVQCRTRRIDATRVAGMAPRCGAPMRAGEASS